MSRSPDSQDLWITKKEWEEVGENILEQKRHVLKHSERAVNRRGGDYDGSSEQDGESGRTTSATSHMSTATH
jgi:hypothetical protein